MTRGEEGAIAAAVRNAIREMDREQMPAPGTLQALLALAALAATLGPALRAAKADPTWALRQE